MANLDKLEMIVEDLIKDHGEDKVNKAVSQLLNKSEEGLAIPEEHQNVLSEEAINDTMQQLNEGTSDILEAGANKESKYQDKAELMKRKRELETEIDLAESEALMKIRGDSSRSAHIMKDGEKVPLTNDTMRDAYRKEASKKYRKKLAKVEGKIKRIDADLSKANESKSSTKEALNNIRNKAKLQASLLEYLK